MTKIKSKKNKYFFATIVVLSLIIIASVIIYRNSHKSEGTNISTHTINVDGMDRTYTIYKPDNIILPAPLVVMIHGGYGSGAQAEKTYGWDQRADKYNFIVVYPDGFDKSWNAGGGCCGQASKRNVDDVKFISKMIQEISSEIDIDKLRIYATGISNGGMLSYNLACNTDIFAAIGPVSATSLAICNSPTPLSIIAIHGTSDTIIRYNGGQGMGTQKINGPPIPDLNATWRNIDKCNNPDINIVGNVTTSRVNCTNNNSVELITINGAGHQWPGSTPNKAAQILLHTDPPSTEINATDTIWQFFATHHK